MTIDDLAQALEREFEGGATSETFGSPEQVTRRLREITASLSGQVEILDPTTTVTCVARYRKIRSIVSPSELRNICAGVAATASDGWSILADRPLLEDLLEYVCTKTNRRQQLRCYQALLWSYFAFDRTANSTEAQDGWVLVRAWLCDNFAPLNAIAGKPGWLLALERHLNLLERDSCARYGNQLADGDEADLRDATTNLLIPATSWVHVEAIQAQISAVTASNDELFCSRLKAALDILLTSTINIPKPLKIRALGKLLNRYTRLSNAPEHEQLRDGAIALIGNPWLHRHAWDANVLLADGSPDEAARAMVDGWLKRRLITDFFELLSDDARADRRRLKYWLKHEEYLDDLWIALGPSAALDRRRDYVSLRERAAGRLLQLANPGDSKNNAFVMRFGGLSVVEFGVTGNACFVFDNSRLPFELVSGGAVSAAASGLKHRSFQKRFIHMDSTYEPWEEKIDQWLRPRLEMGKTQNVQYRVVTPASAPRSSSGFSYERLIEFLKREGLESEDNRVKGGALWVFAHNQNQKRSEELIEMGFRFKEGRGWWRE